jgi:hypothetical protein
MSVADELQQQIDRFARNGRSMVIDLSQLDFVDSSGLRSSSRHRAIALPTDAPCG